MHDLETHLLLAREYPAPLPPPRARTNIPQIPPRQPPKPCLLLPLHKGRSARSRSGTTTFHFFSRRLLVGKMAGVVVVFDFDRTIIDCDSDNWLLDGFGASEAFERLLETAPWNSAMDVMMAQLHARGVSVEEIADRLREAALDPHIVSAIKTAYALGCELRIVSDANTFFIRTILDHHGLSGYFSEINTNPGFVDEQGKVGILPFHDFRASSHGCPDCPPNMCKSAIVRRIQAEAAVERKQIVYLGDGKGDYCPALNLTERDFAMPRKGYPMWELIRGNPLLLRAEVREWSDGEEQERVLLGLVCCLLSVEAIAKPIAADCKFPTSSTETRESLPKALPVSNY